MTETTPDPTDRATYWRWVHGMTRFSDTDRIGHVNNTVVPQMIEVGRVTMIDQLMGDVAPVVEWVVARLEVDYLAELNFPSTLDIGTRVVAVGNSSYTVISGVFEGDRCIARARSVLVHAVGGRALPPPESAKAALLAELNRSGGVDSPRAAV